VTARFEEVLFRGQARPCVNGTGVSVQTIRGRPCRCRLAFDVRKAHEHELADAGLPRGGNEIPDVTRVRPGKKNLRMRREKDPREVDDTVHAFARRRDAGGIPQVGSGDLDARMRPGVERQRPAVNHQSQLVGRVEQRGSEPGPEISGGARDEEPHSQII
jgi:hypothetical protein